MRQSPSTGKVNCRIIDFVDSTNRVAGVVSTPTLFGLDPEELIDGKVHSHFVNTVLISHVDESVETLEARAQIAILQDAGDEKATSDSRDDIPDPKYITYVDYENPFALVDSCSGAPHVSKLSVNAWVGCGDDIYILECLGKGYIRVERVAADEGNFDDSCCNPFSHVPLRTAYTLSCDIYRGNDAYTVCEGVQIITIHAEKADHDCGDAQRCNSRLRHLCCAKGSSWIIGIRVYLRLYTRHDISDS